MKIEFMYDGVGAEIEEDDLFAARTAFYDQLEEAEGKRVSKDGIPYCGCDDCYNRVTSGFWITWTLRQVRDGAIRLES